jgi:hypothetical protein
VKADLIQFPRADGLVDQGSQSINHDEAYSLEGTEVSKAEELDMAVTKIWGYLMANRNFVDAAGVAQLGN